MINKKGFTKETAREIVCAIENAVLPILAALNSKDNVQKIEKRTKQIKDVLFVEYRVFKTPILNSIQTTVTLAPNKETTN